MTMIVPLDNVAHAGMRVAVARGTRWGDVVNRIPVFPPEFEAVQREYPILFGTADDGSAQAFALLGFDPGENLFLDGERWDARYVPALAARGPFSIGMTPRDDGTREPMVHVDLDHPGIADEGEALFLPHGGHAPYLDRVTEVLRTIHAGHDEQAPMIAAFAEAGLIEPVKLEVMLDETLRYDLVDFATVSAAALGRLTPAQLADLHARGFLAAAFHAAASLGNVAELIRRKNLKRAAA